MISNRILKSIADETQTRPGRDPELQGIRPGGPVTHDDTGENPQSGGAAAALQRRWGWPRIGGAAGESIYWIWKARDLVIWGSGNLGIWGLGDLGI